MPRSDPSLWLTEWSLVVLIILFAFISRWLALRSAASWLHRQAPRLAPSRVMTLRALLGHAITFVVILLAGASILAVFVPAASLLTFLGLFSAGLGLGARPLVSDYLTGFTLIFEDQFAVGEKVEIAGVAGYIESVDLRTSRIRADTGELYIIPNGDVRNIRNFSRASFSPANVVVTVPTTELSGALSKLQSVVDQVNAEFPTMPEPAKILSERGLVSTTTDLTLVVKASFGHGPATRTRVLELVQAELGSILKHAVVEEPPPAILLPATISTTKRQDPFA